MSGRPTACPIPCNLCGSVEVAELSLTDRGGRYLRTTMCQRCGLVWSNPRPGEDEVRRYYSRDYRQEYKGTTTPRPRDVLRAGRGAVDRYRALQEFIRPGDRVLDVGCGGGELVYLLRQLGHDARGIEPDTRYAGAAARELDVPIEIGFAQEVAMAEKSLDAILLFHALEHMEDPCAIVSRLHRWLADGGLLVVEVPNVEASCQAPRHRFHAAHFYSFNARTLEAIGQKAGFSVQKTTWSADGGNVTTVFRKAGCGERRIDQIPGNSEQIAGVIRKHTSLAHYLSAVPYRRAVGRALRWWDERRASRFRSRRAILDALIADIARATGRR